MEPDGLNRSYDHYIVVLLRRAQELPKEGKTLAWYAHFLAGSISLARQTLPPRPERLSQECILPGVERRTLRRWTLVAELVNRIVSGLYDTWKEKAFLIYEGLACK